MKRLFVFYFLLGAGIASAAILPGFVTKRAVKGHDQRGSFDIRYVQLTGKVKNRAVRAKVNLDLEKTAKGYICEADPAITAPMYANIDMNVSYATDTLLGISYFTDYSCGGPYPDHSPIGAIYSLRTGNELDVEKEVRDAAALRRLVVEKVLANAPKSTDPLDGCADLYNQGELTAGYYVYTLREGALVVTQDYPHVTQACAFDTSIPLSEIKPLLKTDSDLNQAK